MMSSIFRLFPSSQRIAGHVFHSDEWDDIIIHICGVLDDVIHKCTECCPADNNIAARCVHYLNNVFLLFSVCIHK